MGQNAARTSIDREHQQEDLYSTLFKPGEVVEIRSFVAGNFSAYKGYSSGIVSGYFDNPEDFIRCAEAVDNTGAEGTYFTLNPVKPALLSRAKNRLIGKPKATTSDADILCLRCLPIDADARRASGISATDEELKYTEETVNRIKAWLKAHGFPDAILGFSGNGHHYILRLPDLLNTPENVTLIKNAIAAIADKFDTDKVEIDRKVFNPSRIWKLYGTMARKGDNTEERPHRRSKLLDMGDRQPITLEQLKWLASQAPQENKTQKEHTKPAGAWFDLSRYLDDHDRHYFIKEHSVGTMYCLDECIINPDHKNNESAIIQRPDGSLLYQCFHNGCAGKKWKDARQIISGNKSLAPWMTSGNGNGRVETTSVEEWPEPIPLDDSDSLPSFPVNSLPPWCRRMAEEITEVHQVDAGLPGSVILGVLSTALATKAVVDLGTHREPLNTYIASISDSGERKSTTVERLTAPVYVYQGDKREQLAPIVAEYETDRRVLENKKDKLEKDAAKAEGNEYHDLIEQAKSIARQLVETPEVILPTYVVDDITIEQVGILAAENGERLSIISAEGGIFDIMAGKYSDGYVSIDIYLKGHAGDHWSNDRVGRKHLSMESPALTVCLAVQPDIIRQLGDKREFRGRGLLARFLYSVCQPKAGTRSRQKKEIDTRVERLYQDRVRNLLELSSEKRILTLEPEAHTRWDAFYNAIEVEMRKGGKLGDLRDWGSKLPGAVARISGLLHFAEYGQSAYKKDISANTINAACSIGLYYIEHVLAAFGLMKQDPRIEAGKKILESILTHKLNSFKGRDMLRTKSAFKTIDDLQPGLTVLSDRGYIRFKEAGEYKGKGRPEGITYQVNPKLFDSYVNKKAIMSFLSVTPAINENGQPIEIIDKDNYVNIVTGFQVNENIEDESEGDFIHEDDEIVQGELL